MLAGRGAKPENGDGKATDYVKLFGCLRRPTAAGSGARRPSSQEARLGLQPFADYASALLAIGRPSLGKDVIGDLVAFDAERILDDLGGMIAVTAVDGLLEQVPVPSGAVFRRDRDGMLAWLDDRSFEWDMFVDVQTSAVRYCFRSLEDATAFRRRFVDATQRRTVVGGN